MFKNILFLSLVGIVASSQKITIDPVTRSFQDQFGRSRIFHGTNVVVKGFPYLPEQDNFHPHMSLSEKDLQDMIDWGITFVRLGVMWESVEVAPRQYNMTYLDEVDKLINRMGEKGIYTMVDAHQDLFSRATCGEGMPSFYATDLDNECPWNVPGQLFKIFGECKSLDDYGIRKDEKGWRNLDDCLKTTFIKYYTSPEVCSSFEGLYQNKYGIQDRFVDFWDIVSKKFSSNQYVVGYDPINEPWPANFYKEFSLFYRQTKFDQEYLFPMLKRISDQIRINDKEKIVFFEPAQFPDTFPLFGGIVASIGFNQTPGGQEYIHKETLNDHTYCCQSDPNICDSGEPPLAKKDVCKAFHVSKVEKRNEDAQRLGVPMFFTEFGACSNTESCFHEITSAAEQFDKYLGSWAYWMFKGFGDFTTTGKMTEGMYDEAGNLQLYKMLALQRSFLHSTQGVPQFMQFYTDADLNGTFVANYTLNTSIPASTEIFFNEEVYYPTGYKLSLLLNNSPAEDIQIDATQKNYIRIFTNNSDHDGKTISLLLTRKNQQNQTRFMTDDKSIQIDVQLQEQVKELEGFTYFEVTIPNDLSKKITFSLNDVNGNLICSGSSSYHECFTYNHLGYQATMKIETPGWLGESIIFNQYLNNLNGQIIKIDLSAIQQELIQ